MAMMAQREIMPAMDRLQTPSAAGHVNGHFHIGALELFENFYFWQCRTRHDAVLYVLWFHYTEELS